MEAAQVNGSNQQAKDKAAEDWDLAPALREFRRNGGLSLGQVGQVVGVPASTVKRWEEGVAPRSEHFILAALTIGLAANPRAVLQDLQLQGLEIQLGHWQAFAGVVDGARAALELPDGLGVDRPKMAAALAGGLKGLMTLISLALMDLARRGKMDGNLAAPKNFIKFLKA